jgi:hypothetical protein
MELPKKPMPISALHEILIWSTSRPQWQRDALRRIVVQGSVSAADINELDQLCRSKHELAQACATTLKAVPLDESHIPPGLGSQESVTLMSIGNLQGVNRLPSDQTIPFGVAPGLTVIYGDNGTGKSGYARVIKKACRTRGALPEVCPDVFAPSPAGPPSGVIVCLAGSTKHTLAWQDGVPSDARLANVFVFDASTADHYLEQDSPAIFTPSGLDVLPKLSKTCDAVSQLIKRDLERVKADIEGTAKNWKYSADTPVGKLISGLSANTQPSQVQNLSGLTDKERHRLKDIGDALKSDPKQKARETRSAAARIKAFSEKVTGAYSDLSEVHISALHKIIDDAKSTQEVAVAFASGQFDETYLTGTGQAVWHSLWEAARLFSVSFAYKDQEFPFTGKGARCVLCQQNLDSVAAERLKAFDSFCKDQSQELAEEASSLLKERTEKIQQMNPLTPEYVKVETDLLPVGQAQMASISAFVKNADERLATIRGNLSKDIWVEPAQLSESPAEALKSLATALEERAKTEESADDPNERKKLEAERDDLADRDWLSGVKADVFAQIERYREVSSLEASLKDTVTKPITTRNAELTKSLVTDAFCDRFETEAKGLGLRTIAVKMEDIEGKKGEVKFGLRLEGSLTHTVGDIASEGERRCIALAAFLAELSQASHKSALVFDDPVSSFDNRYRERTSARLALEAKERQVIIFTHDVVFLNDLQTHAASAGVPVELLHLEWNGNVPGQCLKGLPWDWKSAEDRFDKLEKEQKAIAKSWNPVPNEENVKAIRQAYSWLRATLERLVEKVILNDVVLRFRSYVDVKKLDGVVGFSVTECEELQRLYQRCHDVTDAHDPSAGKSGVVPEPTDLLNDIEAAKKLSDSIKTRKKSAAPSSATPATP